MVLIFICNLDFKLVLFDEVNVILKLGYLKLEDLLVGLEEKLEDFYIIFIGRGVFLELIENVDLVMEM